MLGLVASILLTRKSDLKFVSDSRQKEIAAKYLGDAGYPT